MNGYPDVFQRGCVTPAQIGNLGDALEGDIEMLDGYEELPEDCQQKVKRAIDQGHVDDEDWKGVGSTHCHWAPIIDDYLISQDLEQNRPGKRGFRSPAAKKKKKVVEANEVILESFPVDHPSTKAHLQVFLHPLSLSNRT